MPIPNFDRMPSADLEARLANPNAAFVLGMRLATGTGPANETIEPDHPRAAQLLNSALEQGSPLLNDVNRPRLTERGFTIAQSNGRPQVIAPQL